MSVAPIQSPGPQVELAEKVEETAVVAINSDDPAVASNTNDNTTVVSDNTAAVNKDSGVATESAVQPQSVAGATDVAVDVPEEQPQAVSEKAREEAKAAEDAKAQTGFFKQNLQKIKRNLCGPLHLGDALWAAWNIFWFILAGTTPGGLKWFWLFLAFMFYLWYLHWNWKSDERLHLWHIYILPDFEKYWDELRMATPTICFQTESWHWERRVHTTYYTNSSGGTSSSTTVTYVRKVTHSEIENFPYSHWEDVSGGFDGLSANNATFVNLWKEHTLADGNTLVRYYSQFHALCQRNRSKDTYMDTDQYMVVPGFRRCSTVYKDAASRPFLLYGWIFMLCCVLMLSWPIKFYFEFVVKKGGLTITKKITS